MSAKATRQAFQEVTAEELDEESKQIVPLLTLDAQRADLVEVRMVDVRVHAE